MCRAANPRTHLRTRTRNSIRPQSCDSIWLEIIIKLTHKAATRIEGSFWVCIEWVYASEREKIICIQEIGYFDVKLIYFGKF